MTKDQFYSWCDEQSAAIMNLYAAGEVPTVDRLDSRLHYSADNIRVASFLENRRRGHEMMATRHSIPIRSVDPKTGAVVAYRSLSQAQKGGFDIRAIQRALRGDVLHHGGLRWEYA